MTVHMHSFLQQCTVAVYRPFPPSTKITKPIATPNPAKQQESPCCSSASKRHPVSQTVSILRAFVFYDSSAPLKVHHLRHYVHWCYFLWRISVKRKSMLIFSVVSCLPVPHTTWIRSQISSSWLNGKPLVHSQTQNEHEQKSEISPQDTLHACLWKRHQRQLSN